MKKDLFYKIAALFLIGNIFTCCIGENENEIEPRDNVILQGVDEEGIKIIELRSIPKEIRQKEYFILKTQEQRDVFLEQTKSHHDENDLMTTPFKILTSELNIYEGEFFNKFNLVMIFKAEPDIIRDRYKVEEISLKDNELYIRIRRKILGKGEFSMSMVTCWFINIPVKKEYFDGEIINVEYRDTTRW